MSDNLNLFDRNRNRRGFLKAGLTAAGATVGTGLLVRGIRGFRDTLKSDTADKNSSNAPR